MLRKFFTNITSFLSNLITFFISVCTLVAQTPPPPTLLSPGSSTSPGPVINTLTPTFQW